MTSGFMNVLDLFSGIGGFSLGLERAGMKTVAFCEIEDYPRRVLAKHWPGVPIYEDVRDVSKSRLEADGIGRIDVITGGFPCQDISLAGKQKGLEGERSGLWSECARLLGDIRPRYAIFENVTALISGDNGEWFKRVLWDISQVGYDAEWHCIPASELGANHHRDRVWIIAYPRCKGQDEQQCDIRPTKQAAEQANIRLICQDMADTMQQGLQGSQDTRAISSGWQERDQLLTGCDTSYDNWASEPDVGRVANGVSNRSHRLKGLGNAVVPQIPELIGRAIIENES